MAHAAMASGGENNAETGGGGGSSRSSTSGESTTTAVPRVGGVRCYWAFLRPVYPRPDTPSSKLELVFVHPDPVLGAHLAKQKMSLMGRGVIEFIHPAEREQARHDLTSAISADDLQGSVTRVRFARLSRLKMILGCPPEDIEYPEFEWKSLVVDEDYLVLDLVLNWVADGMLLAFFHAITDIDPVANNDPNRRAEGWSNLCGTANMDSDQIAALQQDITKVIPRPLPSRLPPTRIFQIHSPPTPTSPATLLFSWPPPRPSGSYARYDGLYDAEEYAELMRGVEMDAFARPHNPGDIRTTCTTRFGAQHSLTNEGVYRLVTSTFIPYGGLIFACFQTIRMFDLPERSQEFQVQQQIYPQSDWQSISDTPMESGPSTTSSTGSEVYKQQYQQPQSAYLTPQAQHMAPPTPNSLIYPTPPRQASNSSPSYPVSSSGQLQPEWSAERGGPAPSYRPQSFYPFPPPQHPSATSSAYQLPESTRLYPSYPPPHTNPISIPHPQSSSSPGQQYPHQIPTPRNAPPPPPHDYQSITPDMTSSIPETKKRTSTPPPAPTTRPLIKPPGDVERCVACGTRESPEWRRSEGGVKDLCNACGLRLARQVAKRDGKQKPRKKKDEVR